MDFLNYRSSFLDDSLLQLSVAIHWLLHIVIHSVGN